MKNSRVLALMSGLFGAALLTDGDPDEEASTTAEVEAGGYVWSTAQVAWVVEATFADASE